MQMFILKGCLCMPHEQVFLDLAKYRIQKASESLNAAKVLIDNGMYAESINRSYYSIFHAVRGLLALDQFDTKKHSGVISYFNMNFVKTNKFPKEASKIINIAFTIRNKSDYDDFFIATKEDAIEQIVNANVLIDMIKKHFENNL
jgi:uncharacterized protein (UPF0332 family)